MTTRTAAQIEASRTSGARSQGPVTPEGKAASAQNARSHGLCAKFRVAYYEDTPAFLEILAGLRTAYRPSDAQEHELVRAIALASWQVRRAQELDMQFWCWHSEPNVEDEFRHLRQIEANGRARICSLDTIMRYQARAETARTRAMRDLATYRSKHPHRDEGQPSPEPVPAAPIANTNEPGHGANRTNEPETTPIPPGTNEPEPPAEPTAATDPTETLDLDQTIRALRALDQLAELRRQCQARWPDDAKAAEACFLAEHRPDWLADLPQGPLGGS